MNTTTKQKLITIGAKAMLAKSYHGVGLQEVLAEAQVPKGSFYHYFASKEAFGVAIIEYYGDRLAKNIDEFLQDTAYSPRERIVRYFQAVRDYYESRGFGRGCLVAKLATEVADPSEPMRLALKAQFDKWTALFAKCIAEGQQQQEISDEASAESLAEFLYTAWEGVLIRMQVNGNLQPIEVFLAQALDSILPPCSKK
ncbi:MAG: TetR family transcriptional regulator C-terminal domain-containing protein [Sporomusaceae bacterium]|nr:TetR family transcriptional regulator C-terminal domain-containing protein [Sporomusaceae bacterium]